MYMAVQVEEYIENTFEHQYLFRNKGPMEAHFVVDVSEKEFSRDCQGYSKVSVFSPEHLMLLEEIKKAVKE